MSSHSLHNPAWIKKNAVCSAPDIQGRNIWPRVLIPPEQVATDEPSKGTVPCLPTVEKLGQEPVNQLECEGGFAKVETVRFRRHVNAMPHHFWEREKRERENEKGSTERKNIYR